MKFLHLSKTSYAQIEFIRITKRLICCTTIKIELMYSFEQHKYTLIVYLHF